MKRASAAAVMLLLLASLAAAPSQNLPPGPTVEFQGQCKATGVPADVDAYQAVLDFAPRAWTSKHSHSGPACISVLQGGITFRVPGGEKNLRAGESYLETTHEVHAAGNTADAHAMMLVTNLTPKGQKQTDEVEPSQNPPSLVSNNKFELSRQNTELDVIQTVLDFPPGVWTPLHTHGGQVLNTVLSGAVTLRENGVERLYEAGQGWTEKVGQAHAAGNAGSEHAKVFVTFLLPPGAKQTTIVVERSPEPALPTPPIGGGGGY